MTLRFLLDIATPSSVGGERLKSELARAVDRSAPTGSEGHVLCRRDQDLDTPKRLQRHVVEAGLRSRLQKLSWIERRVPEFAARLDADAVFPASGFFGRRLVRSHGVVGTTNNMLPFTPELSGQTSLVGHLRLQLQRFVTSRCLRRADRVLLHSRHALDTLAPHVEGLRAKVRVVPSGIPGDARLTEPPEHPYGGTPYFLYFSPMKPYKNHRLLVDAYRLLGERRDDLPDLLFAGHASSESYLGSLQDAIESAGLQERVRYLGELPRAAVPAWLHHAAINLFPSLCETSSVIQAEILGAGGAMAASDLPPMNETPAGAAELFDPFDAADVARVMETLWAEPQRREALRRAAVEAAGVLTWEACGAALWEMAAEAADLSRDRRGR